MVTLEQCNMDKEDLANFINSKGWNFVLSYLGQRFVQLTDIATANGAQVSNSRKLEAVNQMAIIREVTAAPQTTLEILNQGEQNETV